MKRMIGLMMAMFLYTFATSAFASQVFIAEQHPTTTIATAWNEFQTTGGGLDNANVWVNIWPSDGKVGAYLYTQASQPSFSQIYGGIAGRAFDGELEGGFGFGAENANGHLGLRHSAYGIFSRGRFSSLNIYESSKYSGWWFKSLDMYYVVPDRLELGYSFQRFLGGGPSVRYTTTAKRLTFQPYLTTLFDGDRINPLLGLSVTFK